MTNALGRLFSRSPIFMTHVPHTSDSLLPRLPRWLRALWPWVAAAGSGGLLTLAFPLWDQPWLAWVALTPLVAAVWPTSAGGVAPDPAETPWRHPAFAEFPRGVTRLRRGAGVFLDRVFVADDRDAAGLVCACPVSCVLLRILGVADRAAAHPVRC